MRKVTREKLRALAALYNEIATLEAEVSQ